MRPLLEVRDLWVEVGGRLVLRGVSLAVGEGEVHALFGPNAAGKSTLLMTIMGIPRLRVVRGRILYGGVDITHVPPYERARMGIALAFQRPPKVGVKLRSLIEAMRGVYSDGGPAPEELGLGYLLDRELHHGFSGGESKRVELFLAMLQRPRLALLDEPDSGVDVESLADVAKFIERWVESGVSMVIVTHTGSILERLSKVDAAHVMVDGRIIVTSRSPAKLLELVRSVGYSGLAKLAAGGGLEL